MATERDEEEYDDGFEDDELDENELDIEVNVSLKSKNVSVQLTTDVLVDRTKRGEAEHKLQGVLDFMMRSMPVAQLEMKGIGLNMGSNGEIEVLPKSGAPREGGSRKRRRKRKKDDDTKGGEQDGSAKVQGPGSGHS